MQSREISIKKSEKNDQVDKVITDVERTEQVLKNTLHQIMRHADKNS